jgi:branched-chain amino acid transport system substrate-binding protein
MIEASKNRLIGSLTRRAALVCAGALACGAVLAGFAPVPAADPIKVGHYGSMTGSEATFGQSTDRGIRLAIEEINAAGGVNGRPIELITYDTKGDSGEAGKAVTRLISSDKVAAVLGEVASSLSLAGGAVCQQYGVPMITPSSTNPRVTMGRDFVFRVCFTDDFQAFALAKFVKENLKLTKVAILWDQKQAYSKGLRDEFTKSFTKMSGQIVIDQAYSGGDQDFSAQLAAIATANAEILLVPGYYTDGAAIALQARKKGIKVPLLGGDGWDSEQLGKIAGDAIAGSYYSNHSAPDQPEMQEFVNKFKKKYDGQVPDALTGLGYDAVYLLADAFKKAKSLGGKDVRDVLAQAKDFPGVTGAITMDKNRNASKAAVIVQMTKNDKGEVLPKYVASVAPDKDAAKK